jgi:hypothetical protein
MTTAFLVLAGLGFMALLYAGRGYWAWVSALGLVLAAWWQAGVQSPTAFMTTAGLVIAAALVFGLPVIRRHVVSAPVMRVVRAFLPSMGDTERIALEAAAADRRRRVRFRGNWIARVDRRFSRRRDRMPQLHWRCTGRSIRLPSKK